MVSTPWPQWVVLLSGTCGYLCGHVFLFLLGNIQERTAGHLQRMRVPVLPPFPTLAIQFVSQSGCGSLSLRLIGVALKASGVERLFLFLVATRMSSLVQCLFRSFAHF